MKKLILLSLMALPFFNAVAQTPQLTRDAVNGSKYLFVPEQDNNEDFRSVSQFRVGPYLTLGNYGYQNNSWIGNNAILNYSAYHGTGSNGDANHFVPNYAVGKALVINLDYATADFTGYTYNWNNSTAAVNLNDFTSSWVLGIDRSYFKGKVGIGTNYPAYKLDVTNNVGESENFFRIKAQDADDYFSIVNGTAGNQIFMPYLVGVKKSDNKQALYLAGQIEASNDNGNTPVMVFDSRYQNDTVQNRPLFQWSSYNIPKMIMAANGNLGIGTTSIPDQYKLAVAGSIISEEVVVKLQGLWPDYIFENDYPLMPLSDLEKYLKQYNRLPEIPSAEEVSEKGQALGELNRLLLKKIEELTLYVIQLEKRDKEYLEMMTELKRQVFEMKKESEKLELLIKSNKTD